MSTSKKPLLPLSPAVPSPGSLASPFTSTYHGFDTLQPIPSQPEPQPVPHAQHSSQLVGSQSAPQEAQLLSHSTVGHAETSKRPWKSTREKASASPEGHVWLSKSASEASVAALARTKQEPENFGAVELSSRTAGAPMKMYSDISHHPGLEGQNSGSGSGRSHDLRSGSIKGSARRDHDGRVIYINNPGKTNDSFEYAGNRVQTSKYNVLNFLPKNLFEQFHRIAYIYFFLILCLNQIPELAVFGRFASAVPLGVVLVITAIKDGYEDWRRHRSDRKENNRLALVYQEGHYVQKAWKDISVGEMVKVQANETIPCDLVLLKASDSNGVAFVQTINLDGESNLKTRYALMETAARLDLAEKLKDPVQMTGLVVCEKPNRNIYGFTGYLELDNHKHDIKQLPLGPTNIILRGCELKNTSWVIGLAVYTGQETKAMLNSSGPQSKRSRLEQKMNRETIWLSIFLFITCFVGGLGMGLWLIKHGKQLNILPYFRKIEDDDTYHGKLKESIFAFLSCLISFQVMIPISLYISMELVRIGQSYFMIQDMEMYHIESNTRLQCRALNINEDLGQIEYIFSDKTGTLTENKMEFHCASIFGENYSHPKVAIPPAGDLEGSVGSEDYQVVKEVLGKLVWKPKAGVKVDPNLVRMLQASDKGLERIAVHDFLLTLATCNTVVPTKVKLTSSGNLEMEMALAEDEVTGVVEYQGESPDEQALVSAAASYGYTLLERTSNYVVVNILGEVLRFDVLGLHEFDSIRKCMSVVLRYPDGSVRVLVKGADSSVLQKVSVMAENTNLDEAHQAQILFNTQLHLELYSKEGLRTLVVASRTLSGAEVSEWQKLYAKANAALAARSGILQEAAGVVEKNLFLLGATGIEDKLQVGVPEAIATLREAGIKIWVLTGDKQETAISIGFSCELLTANMKQIIISASDKESCRSALRNATATYVVKSKKGRRSMKEKERSFSRASSGARSADMSSEFISSSLGPATSSLSQIMKSNSFSGGSMAGGREKTHTQRTLALIIDGNSLVHALDKDLEQELFDLATACKVVICCRVAPLQKGGIVSLMKEKSKKMTLAIGDGANDVSMIQMADVGVGISGQEGRQAVMASDFAMGQFRFLPRLLLVHGHLNYRRLGYMVLYNFYRNAVFVMLLFWYILYTAFSTSPAITEWSLVFYSLIYTSVPTIVVAIFDRDLSQRSLLKYPGLYRSGHLNESYNRPLFWLTMLDTLWQSLVLFYVPVLSYKHSTVDIWSMGSIWTISVVVLVNLHLAMDIELFTWMFHLAIWGSIVATYICLIVLDLLKDNTSLTHYGVIFHVAATGCYWLNILLILGLGLLPRFIFKVVKQRFWPSDVQIAREEEILRREHSTSLQ